MALLEIQNLTWTPPDAESSVFEGLSFSLENGEIAALTGPSGAGKSSALRVIIGLVPGDEGVIRLDGRELESSWIREFRRRVSIVFQKPSAIADTVDEDLTFARTCCGDQALSASEQDQMLERLGLDSAIRKRDFDSLSGGEQQRVQVVRALTSRPDVVLLDEPTASLDEEHERDVEALLREYLEGSRALLWVSHSNEQLERLDARRISIGGES